MAAKPETRFRQGRVIPFLKTLKNTVAFPIQQQGISGDPDYILCCHGRFVALELKAEGEAPRPLQQYKLGEVMRAHGVALVASPDTWGLVSAKLRRMDMGDYE